MIKSRLESEGILVVLSYESSGLVYGITIDGLAETRVMISEAFAQEARDILAATPLNESTPHCQECRQAYRKFGDASLKKHSPTIATIFKNVL